MFGMIAMLAMAMFASSLVLAEDNATDKCFGSAADGVKCGSNTSEVAEVSSGTIFWKEVGLWFTFNQERKMDKEMELAQLRLKQAEYATQNNMTKAAEKALNSYAKLIARANKRSELIQAKDSTSADMVKLAAMDQAILAHQATIERISAKLATANLTDEQRVVLEARLANAENVTVHLQDVQSDKEEKMKIRLMAEGNMTEEEAEAKIDEAKDKADEVVGGAKEAWNNFKEEARANNMTPKELAKERRQEFREEVKGSLSDSDNSNKNN